MTTRRPQLLYRREIDGKVLTLTEKAGVIELKLLIPFDRNEPGSGLSSSVLLVDPTYSQPVQQGRRV